MTKFYSIFKSFYAITLKKRSAVNYNYTHVQQQRDRSYNSFKKTGIARQEYMASIKYCAVSWQLLPRTSQKERTRNDLRDHHHTLGITSVFGGEFFRATKLPRIIYQTLGNVRSGETFRGRWKLFNDQKAVSRVHLDENYIREAEFFQATRLFKKKDRYRS